MSLREDRRKRVRVPVQSKIRHSQYQVLGTPVFQENSSLDLSSGGISFETAREYKKGNLVLLEVEIESQPLKLLVCVAWVKKASKDGIYEVGAELIAIDPEHKRKMQSHLTKLIASISKKKPAKKKVIRKKQKVKAKPKKLKKKKKTTRGK